MVRGRLSRRAFFARHVERQGVKSEYSVIIQDNVLLNQVFKYRIDPVE